MLSARRRLTVQQLSITVLPARNHLSQQTGNNPQNKQTNEAESVTGSGHAHPFGCLALCCSGNCVDTASVA